MLTTTTLVDVALAAIALEALGLWTWWLARGRRGLHPFDVLAHLAAGALLLGAVRVAVSGANPLWVLALVAASLPAHLLDLWRRSRATTAATRERERRDERRRSTQTRDRAARKNP